MREAIQRLLAEDIQGLHDLYLEHRRQIEAHDWQGVESFQRVETLKASVRDYEQAVTAGGSAIETLQTLPSLEVDTDGNISLRGNQNVVIQINGRPVPVRGAFLAALLRQIPADKVERVEVIPNPSAKYEPDGMGGIVNIVLAEGTDRGLSGGQVFSQARLFSVRKKVWV